MDQQYTSPDWQNFSLWDGRDILLWKAPEVIARLQQRSKGEWFENIDTTRVVETLRKLGQGLHPGGLSAAILNNSHLLVYSLGGPWFAQDGERWLIEQFFMRVDAGEEAGAYEALELLAEDLGASRIIMATALARRDEALGKVYERYGYAKQSSQYVKEARWLQLAQSSPA